MDETPMRFELPATRTLEFTGNRAVPITTCGADKQSFTVALAVKANGEKLPPKLTLKASGSLELTYRRECRSRTKKGCKNEEGIYFFACLFSFVL